MVLRKERSPKSGTTKLSISSSSSDSSSIPVATMSSSNEQPVKKRQKIDVRNNSNTGSNNDQNGSEQIISEISILKKDINTKPDILVVVPSTASSSSSSISSKQLNNYNNSIPNSITSSPTSSHNSSTDEVDKCTIQIPTNQDEIPDLLRTNHCSSTSSSAMTISSSASKINSNNNCKNNNINNNTGGNDDGGNEMAEFEEYLIKQCLCGVNEITLRKPFESHYSHDIINGTKRIVNLNEWPTSKLIQFLSNLQLLFDIYLKQNNKGFICSRIMDICDALIRNDHNLIDEIIDLANYNDKYIQFLSGRVLASFLVIAKNNMDDNWLKKLVDNLFLFEHIDFIAIRKIQFTLEIIKRIIEWKDIDTHPLDDELDNSNIEIINQQQQQQPLENNYFARNFINELERNPNENNINRPSTSSNINNIHSSISNNLNNDKIGCQLITLTDSESFDTTHLKCITIKILENKWPALVKNMSNLILTYHDVINAENCILTFLYLWENIISVKANLSIVETLPFHAQLNKFELLLNNNLSCTIYKQMLSLFNESLCYGSTLALQDSVPEETRQFAHQIGRHVRDYRILRSLPLRQPENIVSLIGYKGQNIKYELNSIYRKLNNQQPNHKELMELNEIPGIDKTILQKIVLLVLKSVAIFVKDIRSGDSSDSSIDTIDSSERDAFAADMEVIGTSIHDALKKLRLFMITTLKFLPETHFSKILIHLFDDQDDHLIESMVCTLDVTSVISFRNNTFTELVSMLNPVLTFLEFLQMIAYSSELLLDLLVSNETCFLLYLLRFLKYIRINWSKFVSSCEEYNNNNRNNITTHILDDAMTVLIRLRLQISRLVSKQLYPYDISPVLRLLESCESLYEGNELS